MNEQGFRRKTYNEILDSMYSNSRELFGDNINLSERSPLGMFLQAIAWEISNTWEEIEHSHYSSFSLYADGVNLDNSVSNYGRDRFKGTKSFGKAKFIGTDGVTIPLGFIIGTKNKVIFETLEEVEIVNEEAKVRIGSVEIGEDKNVPVNTITEIVNPLAGVDSVTNTEGTLGGTGIEKDDNLRERNLSALREPTTGDNDAQYREWAREVPGVGGVKVLATTPKAGYLTIVISGADGNVASEELINQVYDYVDSKRPVTAGIYVESATAKDINVSVRLSLAQGYDLSIVRDRIIVNLDEYIKDSSLNSSYISKAIVGKLILQAGGVLDYDNLTINGLVGSIELLDTEVAILKEVSLELIE